MNTLKSMADLRLLLLCFAAFAMTACGQQDQTTSEAVDDGAATEMTRSDKVPVTTTSDEARALYDEGLALADNLQLVEANEVFAKSVEADPGFAMGYFRLAQTSQTAAAFFRAVGQAEDNAANSTEGEQLYIRALIAFAENDQDEQLEAISNLLGMYPNDERTHMQLANYYNAQQNFAEAVKHFEHATSINPEFASAFNALGYARRGNGDLDGAKVAFARYVELIPDEANPYDSYAELLMEMGEYDESIANYRKALELDPDFPSAYAGISTNESLKGNHTAAQAAAKEMLDAARTDAEERRALLQSVRAHLFAGKTEEAIDVAEEVYALARRHDDLAAMGNISDYMGDITAVSGDAANALEYYEIALKHRQDSAINDANKEQAERTYMFKAAIAAIVDDDLETATARATDYTTAAEAYGTAFERRRIHEIAGYLAGANGDNEESAAELAQANQLDPIVVYWTAVANKNIGNGDKAAELAAQAAYRNTLSANLPLFRNEAITLLEDLEDQEEMEAE
jgi:tetratricopeptide (TPR) repeat protein